MIGKKLRTLRENKPFSLAQVADSIGVCEKTYRKYESDESYPAHDKILSLANLYGIQPSELEYGKMKVIFVNQDNTEVHHQANTINITSDDKMNQLFKSLENLQQTVDKLKKENEILRKKSS